MSSVPTITDAQASELERELARCKEQYAGELRILLQRMDWAEYYARGALRGEGNSPQVTRSVRGFRVAYGIYQVTKSIGAHALVTLDQAWDEWIAGRVEWSGYTWKQSQ